MAYRTVLCKMLLVEDLILHSILTVALLVHKNCFSMSFNICLNNKITKATTEKAPHPNTLQCSFPNTMCSESQRSRWSLFPKHNVFRVTEVSVVPVSQTQCVQSHRGLSGPCFPNTPPLSSFSLFVVL